MPFGKVAEMLGSRQKRLDGRTDLLEGICAAAALVAAADGDIDDDEIEACQKSVKGNHILTGAFKSGEIDKCINTMLDRADNGRTGRAGLYKEIKDLVDSDKEEREIVLLSAMDVADANGEHKDAEVKVLEKIAAELSLKLADYDV